jgi:hypothetical protein
MSSTFGVSEKKKIREANVFICLALLELCESTDAHQNNRQVCNLHKKATHTASNNKLINEWMNLFSSFKKQTPL